MHEVVKREIQRNDWAGLELLRVGCCRNLLLKIRAEASEAFQLRIADSFQRIEQDFRRF